MGVVNFPPFIKGESKGDLRGYHFLSGRETKGGFGITVWGRIFKSARWNGLYGSYQSRVNLKIHPYSFFRKFS
jgi:hypothetical protein